MMKKTFVFAALTSMTFFITPVFADHHEPAASESHEHSEAAPSAHVTTSTATPETHGTWDAFNEIKAGNKRFSEGKAIHPKQDAATREELAQGQKPHTIVLSCSDSRVPPELVFDQGLGQIFTVRTAGHVLDSPSIASIEYAVEHLGANLIVIMGHESCGAVKATLTTPIGKTAGSPYIDAMIAAIRPGLRGRTIASGDTTFREHVKANTIAATRTLIQKSQIVRDGLSSGKLMIAQGIYSLASGRVDFWDVGSMATLAAEDTLQAERDKKGRKPASSSQSAEETPRHVH